MTSRNVSTDEIVGWVAGMAGVSLLAAVVFWLGRDEPNIRGPAGGIGSVMGMVSFGLGLYCVGRIRQRAVVGAAVLAFVAMASWAWLFDSFVLGVLRP